VHGRRTPTNVQPEARKPLVAWRASTTSSRSQLFLDLPDASVTNETARGRIVTSGLTSFGINGVSSIAPLAA
jgi:hypothetical protein